jgi:hypothetical protein
MDWNQVNGEVKKSVFLCPSSYSETEQSVAAAQIDYFYFSSCVKIFEINKIIVQFPITVTIDWLISLYGIEQFMF